MADDLSDEWWLDSRVSSASASSSSSEDEELAPCIKKQRVISDDSSSRIPTKPAIINETSSPNNDSLNLSQKKKKRKRITDEIKVNPPKAGVPEDLLAVISKQFKGKLSPVEWDELQLDTDLHFGMSNTNSLQTSEYLKTILPKWNKMVKTGDKNKPLTGSPLLLLVTSSAVRSVQLVREVTDFREGKGKLAKLFAKHAKFDVQQTFLKKTVVHLGIGTPNRIKKLLDTGCLNLSRTSAIVLDWNWRNIKLKTITDIPEIREDLFNLFKHYVFPHVHNKSGKLYLM